MKSSGSSRESILSAALQRFDRDGFDHVTVASICAAADASNGSFFHFFRSKQGVAAELFLEALGSYHAAMVKPLAGNPSAEAGVTALLEAHLAWVVECRRQAKFLFEQARAEWLAGIMKEQRAENATFRERIAAWIDPLVAAGALRPMPASLFIGQIIGPAQIICRAWLAGREREDPRIHSALLAGCAVRAVTNVRD